MSVSGLLFRRSLKTSWPRLVLIMLAVAFGVTILLSFTAYFNALSNNEKATWTTALSEQFGQTIAEKEIVGVDPVIYQIETDATNLASAELNNNANKSIRVYDFAKTGTQSPDLAGLELPDPGEYYVSPALEAVLQANPEANLGSRYGETQIGVLPQDLVPYRDQLWVVRGVTPEVLALEGDALASQTVYTLEPNPVSGTDQAILSVVEMVIYLGVFILLLPVLFLVSISTRLGSVQREQRYAALRLVGVTNGQVVRIIAFESLISTVLGIGIGYLGYVVLYPALTDLALTDMRFWPSDIQVLPWQHVAIIAGTLLLSLVSNWWGMRHVYTSPLGVSRRQKMEKRPRAWRLLPLIAGCALVVAVILTPSNVIDVANKTFMIILAVVLIMVGLVLATPWLTYRIAGLVAKVTKRPTTLLATRYIKQHARAIARSVSGVILALFAGSFYLIAISGVPALEAASLQDSPDALLKNNTALIKFVEANTVESLNEALAQADFVTNYTTISYIDGMYVGQCEVLAQYYQGLECGGDHQFALIGTLIENPNVPANQNLRFISYADTEAVARDLVYAAYAAQQGTDPQTASANNSETRFLVVIPSGQIDALRTLVSQTTGGGAQGISTAYVLSSEVAHAPVINQTIDQLASLAYLGIVVTMVVATISIVVSTLSGLYERRHSMFTLHLSGMQTDELKREVLAESLLPLLLTALVSVGLGAWVACVEVTMASDSLTPTITWGFVLMILALLIGATVAIGLTLRVIPRLVDPSNNQTE